LYPGLVLLVVVDSVSADVTRLDLTPS